MAPKVGGSNPLYLPSTDECLPNCPLTAPLVGWQRSLQFVEIDSICKSSDCRFARRMIWAWVGFCAIATRRGCTECYFLEPVLYREPVLFLELVLELELEDLELPEEDRF